MTQEPVTPLAGSYGRLYPPFVSRIVPSPFFSMPSILFMQVSVNGEPPTETMLDSNVDVDAIAVGQPHNLAGKSYSVTALDCSMHLSDNEPTIG